MTVIERKRVEFQCPLGFIDGLVEAPSRQPVGGIKVVNLRELRIQAGDLLNPFSSGVQSR
jgi:hypothetical protein